MKKFAILLVPLLLLCQEAFCGSNYSANLSIYVGGTITLRPMSDCNASNCYGTGISYSTEAFHVERITQTNSLGFQVVNGSSTGTYYDYDLTALKAGIYTVTCSVQYYESNAGYKSRSNTATYSITVKEVPKVISISIPSTLSLSLGDTHRFSPVIYETGASTTLTWNSSNSSVATINASGVLSTTGLGNTTITCTAQNGVSSQCEVTVNPLLVNSITLQETEIEMTNGDKLQLEATILPENATDKSVTWKSSNELVAMVSEKGMVYAIGAGYCQIKATANDGSGKTASCFITVTEKSEPLVGDVNSDGSVDIGDIVTIIDIMTNNQ